MALALVDTGALVALVSRSDRHHPSVAAWFASVRGGLLTTEAVIAETAYVLAASPMHQRAALRWVQRARIAGLLSVLLGVLPIYGCLAILAAIAIALTRPDRSAKANTSPSN